MKKNFNLFETWRKTFEGGGPNASAKNDYTYSGSSPV